MQESKSDEKNKKSWPYFQEMNAILSSLGETVNSWIQDSTISHTHDWFPIVLRILAVKIWPFNRDSFDDKCAAKHDGWCWRTEQLGILDMLSMAQICTENRNNIDIVQFWQCITIFQWVISWISTLNFLQPKKNEEVMHCPIIEGYIVS